MDYDTDKSNDGDEHYSNHHTNNTTAIVTLMANIHTQLCRHIACHVTAVKQVRRSSAMRRHGMACHDTIFSMTLDANTVLHIYIYIYINIHITLLYLYI